MPVLIQKIRPWLVTGALAGGLALGGFGVAQAADSSSSSSTSTPPAAGAAGTNAPDPSTVDHGPNETLLTGSTADHVTAAAKAAIPDGTIIRVETDSDGSPYEAHVRKADGTVVTLKIDSSFTVTSTVDGFGGPGPNGHAPAGSGAASGSTSGAGAGGSA